MTNKDTEEYDPPSLTEYGSLEEITENKGDGSADSNGRGSTTGKSGKNPGQGN
jgi:hypothetical protein